ncbi:MAG: 4Fe-4S dicluster domain-containing protein [Caldiserica bacterium]|nr:4Fe-4S dicluster domain-containing protein [Caldisericota bacterium]
MAKRLSVVDVDRCVDCLLCAFACARRFGEGGLARSAIAVRSVGGMERGFVVIVCRACEDPPCLAACPVGAIAKAEVGVRVDLERCIGCGMCVRACPIGAVFWDAERGKPVICRHCGLCAGFCPHGVIAFAEVPGG